MSATSHTGFFGDGEHTFDLDMKLILELETLTGAGTGALFNRIVKREFRYADLLAVIRLGLIGGGSKPDEAARLTKVYAEGRPIEESYPLALDILTKLWFGNAPAVLEQGEQPAPAETSAAPVPGIGSEA